MFLTATKNNNCVMKLLTITLMHSNLFLNALRLKKCVIKLSSFYKKIVSECFMTKEMCDKAVANR